MKYSWQLLVFTVLFYSYPIFAVNLRDAYQASITKTQIVQIQEARKAQIQEIVTQAKGGLFPNLSVLSTYLRQDTGDLGSSDTTSGAFRRAEQINSRIALTQPLFRGFAEYAGIRGANAQLKAQESSTEQSKLSLYASVAQAYYNVLAAEQDVHNLKLISDLTDKRIKELSARSKIGRSRKGEVLSVQSQLALLRAQLDAALAQTDQARNQFEMVTGLSKQSELQPISNFPTELRNIEYYLKQIDTRPDIQAIRSQLQVAEESIAVARGGHFPSLDLTGNYYLKRTGVLENSKWDFGILLTIPIFQGGIIQSQVRQAAGQSKEQELLLTQSRRQAETDLRIYYRLVASGLDQIRSLTEATKLAENNYQEQTRDYGFGLVSNLEVLQALNALQESKRSLDRTRYQTLSYWALLETTSNTVTGVDR